MIKAAEVGGVLEPVLSRLADYLVRVKAIRDEIVSALLYPVLVLAVGAGAVVMLLNFVIPQFAGVFAEAGAALPYSTQLLLGMSDLTVRYGWFLIAAAVLSAVGFHGYTQTAQGRARWDRIKLNAPILGQLIHEFEIARFTRTLATLLESGVPVLLALNIVGEMVGNVSLAAVLPRLRDGIKRGDGISGPMRACGFFPPMAVYMAKVGEESGRLEEMLLRVADFYDQHVNTSVKRFLSLLEPLLILALGAVVGFIVLSMLLAIFSLSSFSF
jgi:general secretion pathway protein F